MRTAQWVRLVVLAFAVMSVVYGRTFCRTSRQCQTRVARLLGRVADLLLGFAMRLLSRPRLRSLPGWRLLLLLSRRD